VLGLITVGRPKQPNLLPEFTSKARAAARVHPQPTNLLVEFTPSLAPLSELSLTVKVPPKGRPAGQTLVADLLVWSAPHARFARPLPKRLAGHPTRQRALRKETSREYGWLRRRRA